MATPRRGDEWPTPYEYDQAILNHRETFVDRDLQSSALLRTTETKPARLNGSGCPWVCVYRLGNWVVRCFAADLARNIRPPDDIVQRYEGIISYLSQPGNRLPFLLQQEWIEPGIRMRDTSYPFLKLPYIANTPHLGQFLSDLYDKQQPALFAKVAQKLTQQWEQIVQQLEVKQIAHGDLDTSNILVRGAYPSLSLCLIDYDGMYVPIPAFERMGLADQGHENFQPARASLRTFGYELDRFSGLIIYLSLRALELEPSLWESCNATESCLLLGRDDYEHLGQSKRFALLYRESQRDSHLRKCLDELLLSQGWRMPRSLNEILNGYAPVDIRPYEGNPLVAPLDWAIGTQAPLTPPAEPAPLQQQLTPTEPVSPTRLFAPPSTQPPAPASRKSGRTFWIAVLIIFLLIVLGLIIYLVLHASQQPSTSRFVLLVVVSPFVAHIDCRS